MLLAITAGMIALAQPPASDPRVTDAPKPPTLAGPSVPREDSTPSLVEIGSDGRLVPLEVPPAEAAVFLLDLDNDTRTAIERILAERAAIVDRVVRENAATILEAYTHTEAGNTAEAIPLYLGMLDKLAPLGRRGTLQSEIESHLSNDLRQSYRAIIRRYWQAYVIDKEKDLESPATELTPRARMQLRRKLMTDARAEIIGIEIQRSFERLTSGGDQFEQIIAQLALTPQQERAVRAHVSNFVQETLLNPSPEQQRQLLLRILSELTPEQQQKLGRFYAESAGP